MPQGTMGILRGEGKASIFLKKLLSERPPLRMPLLLPSKPYTNEEGYVSLKDLKWDIAVKAVTKLATRVQVTLEEPVSLSELGPFGGVIVDTEGCYSALSLISRRQRNTLLKQNLPV